MPSSFHLPGSTHVAASADALYDDLASALSAAAAAAEADRGAFHLALSGGSTPEPFYMRLVLDPRYRWLPWDATHLWLVDERRVPRDDDRSNFAMIHETLAAHVPLRSRHVHPVPVEADDPAGDYEAELRRAFALADDTIARLDFVLLGMGPDAHTASLFPGSAALNELSRWIAANDGPAVTPPPRITMTFPLLNAARQIAVLITGAQKAATLRRIDEQLRRAGPDPQALPITGIQPACDDGELTWYLDPDAAGDPESKPVK